MYESDCEKEEEGDEKEKEEEGRRRDRGITTSRAVNLVTPPPPPPVLNLVLYPSPPPPLILLLSLASFGLPYTPFLLWSPHYLNFLSHPSLSNSIHHLSSLMLTFSHSLSLSLLPRSLL